MAEQRINVALLRRVMDVIETEALAEAAKRPAGASPPDWSIKCHGGRWDQRYWRYVSAAGCGTVMCFAGWSVALDIADHDGAGDWYYFDDPWCAWHGCWLNARDDDPEYDVSTGAGGRRFLKITSRAQRILGLTVDQAEDLFLDDISLNTLRAKVSYLCQLQADRDRAQDALDDFQTQSEALTSVTHVSVVYDHA